MNARTGFAALVTIGLVAAATLLAPAAAPGQDDETPAGQRHFVETHKCHTCHAVASAGISHKVESTKGPDLGGFTTDDVAALAAYLRKEEDRDGKDHKKTFGGSDEELQQMLDWLGSLEPAE